jgi:hypothetical protein
MIGTWRCPARAGVARGAVARGMVSRGMVARGMVARGMVARGMVVAVTVGGSLLGLALTPHADAAARPTAKLTPAHGAYWGMTTDYKGGISGREAQLGRTMGLHNMFFTWTDSFPIGGQTDDVAKGRVPMVTWEPWNTKLASIAGGTYDANIVSHARAMRDFRHPIFLRFAHEMNGDWYPWTGSANGGGTTGPARYVAAWRHVHDIFVREGATNVVWVWSVNGNDSPGDSWNHWTHYYPGNGYVDWVGVDGYNWGAKNGGWRSFSTIISHSAYGDYAAGKPIMASETASTEAGGDSSDKARWITDLGSAVPSTFPAIEAVVWFDIAASGNNWQIDSSGASLAAYRAVGKASYFGGSSGSGLPAGYFANETLSGTAAVSRTDASINFNWVHGSPAAGIPVDGFSARWTGYITAPSTGAYTFYAKTDDGERLWVNNQLLIDHWADHGAALDTARTTVTLTAGVRYPIRMEYYEHALSAVAQLLWKGPGVAQQIVPPNALSH